VTAAEAGAAAVILDHVWVGAGIHIHTGGPAETREPFLPWRELPDDPDAVFALLSWHARLAPLVGREKDKETLLRWARQGRNARVRLLSGPGGVGKSRLAAEIAEALRGEGWTAGFIRPNDPVVVPLRAGLFLVVDYPEEHPDEVRVLLREVASRELGDVPVRLLVLSRQGGDRWLDLVESAHAGELMDAHEIGLSGLATAEPEHVFSASLSRLAEHYQRPMPTISAGAVRDWVALNPGLHGLPLLLTAAAIRVFLNPSAAFGFSGASVVEALVSREYARLGNAGRAAGLPDRRSAARVFALAAVPGSLDASALRRLAEPKLEIGLPAPDHVIDAVNSLPWWQGDHVPSPEPDLMAAALLAKTLSERSDKAPEWLWAVMEDAVTPQLIDRLGRVAFDAMTVTGSAAGITRHLGEIVRNDFTRARKLELFANERNLPFGLARFAADILQTLLITNVDEATRADLLNNLSNSLSNAGDAAGALAAIRQAVEIGHRLVRDNPARFAPLIAGSLITLSNQLDDAGDGAGALAAIREAADTYRRLAQDNPARFAPDFALSLNNLSNCLSDAGDHAGALAAIREAVEIRGRLAHDNPERFTPDLAMSLNNLSNRLGDGGDRAGALTAIREAAEIRRRMAQDNPARFAPDFATNLNNLSGRLSDVGDGAGALTAIREAVEILRRLTQDNPARFAPNLASSLNNLSTYLSGASDRAGALAAIREAVEIRRRLAHDNPARFAPDLAGSLNNLSNRLNDTGDGDGALAAIREAVEINRRLAQDNPARFAPDLAMSLNNLSNRLSDAGDGDGALAAIREAVDTYRHLAQDNPARFAPALERSLKILEMLERN
jgi:tetratricopeptide (TPR) repeat protein